MGLFTYISCSFFLPAFVLFSFSLLRSPMTVIATTFHGNETDRLALLAFKSKISHDPLGVMDSWNNSLNFCEWHGVTCGHRHQRVTSLSLDNQSLVGSISPYIGNLTFLREISLLENNFNGKIPPEIGQLFRLEGLQIGNNSLGGEIPATLSNCSNLKSIDLGFNYILGGIIPAELGSLLKLRTLFLVGNNLTGGIPHSLGNISSLEILSLVLNRLEGSIPESLSRLTSLTSFTLGENKLSGMLPSSIYNLSSISVFGLEVNQFQGTLPSDLGIKFPNLQVFSVGLNQFSGSIPISISNASKLVHFHLAKNNFTGKVSINWGSLQGLSRLSLDSNNLGSGEEDDLSFLNSLTNCSNLKSLDVSHNHFGGVLPNSIANLSSRLEVLGLGRNEIFGSMPTGIGNLVNLTVLSMEFNLLTGSIPTTIGKLQMLRKLYFNYNKFSGRLPSSMGNLTQLIELYLSRNNFNASIPPSLGNCKRLEALGLSENNFSGSIPKEVWGLSSLSIGLVLNNNNLSGFLSSEVANLNKLSLLDISENKLSGEIPNSLGGCRDIIYLSMEGNLFRGTIPSTLSTLNAIEYLDLSRNNLSGQIPKYLWNFMFLDYLNLSFNNLEGEVPIEGVFKNVSEFSIVGNSKLCGGIPELQLPACLINETKKRGMSLTIKLIVVCCSVAICLVFASILILHRRKKGRKEHPSTFATKDQLPRISYQELSKATSGFSLDNLIGSGSFGSVYKGVLDQDERVVAVKVLNHQHRGASKSFMAECEALKNIRHRNLVKVITSCSSVDFHGNDFKALVYEFMLNGSLERWLHSEADAHVEVKYLNFLQRLNIAIDVAVAMNYLHHHCGAPIIHCDVKPSNILLDNDMTAHVSDFGLARLLNEDNNKRSQNQTSSIGIKGSIGYAAPEYGMGSEASTQGDVYSYGILLLEIFTGKRPTNVMFKDGLNLHNFAKKALPKRVMEIIDPTMVILEDEDEEEITNANNTRNSLVNSRSHKINECLISVVRIGVACSMQSPRERMNMSNTERELHLVRKLFLDIGNHGN